MSEDFAVGVELKDKNGNSLLLFDKLKNGFWKAKGENGIITITPDEVKDYTIQNRETILENINNQSEINSERGYDVTAIDSYNNIVGAANKLGLETTVKLTSVIETDWNNKVYIGYYNPINDIPVPMETALDINDAKAKTFHYLNSNWQEKGSYTNELEWQKDAIKDAYQRISHLINNNHRQAKAENYKVDINQNQELLKKEEKNEYNKNLQNNNIMEKDTKSQQDTYLNNYDYLKKQLLYLGFGDSKELHDELKKSIESQEKNFQIKTTSDKVLPGNKIDFKLNFSKDEDGKITFFNSYDATLITKNGEERNHRFGNKRFTAKEAINLLEGRSVKSEFTNTQTKEKEEVFVKLNFKEKNEYGNYKMEFYNKNYGINVPQIIDNAKLIFDKPEYRDRTIKSIEKGNLTNVKFELEGKAIEGKAFLNTQYKNLNLYDNNMQRVNDNKPQMGQMNEKNEKHNVREQSHKRSM